MVALTHVIGTAKQQRASRDKPYQPRKARIHLWPKGENVMGWLDRRRNQPVKQLREVLPGIIEELCIPGNYIFRWSRKAGCSCGCSPGFIVEGPDAWKLYDIDIFADYTEKVVDID